MLDDRVCQSFVGQLFQQTSQRNPFCVTGQINDTGVTVLLDTGTDTSSAMRNSLISSSLVERLGLPIRRLPKSVPCSGIVPGASSAFTHECTYPLSLRCQDDAGRVQWVHNHHTAYVAPLPTSYDIFLGASYFQNLLETTSEKGNSPGWGVEVRSGRPYFHFYRHSPKKARKHASLVHLRMPLLSLPEFASHGALPPSASYIVARDYDDLISREITYEDVIGRPDGWAITEDDEVISVTLPPTSCYEGVVDGVASFLSTTGDSPQVFNIGSHVEKISPLLEQYAHLFADGMPTNAYVQRDPELTATITPKPGATPPKPYTKRFSPSEKQLLVEEVDKLLKHGFIEQSTSPWVSNVLFVKKKDTPELRFCVDFRAINQLCQDDRFPLPHMQDIFTELRGSKYFSSLDLRSGFFQWTLSEASKRYTAFITDTNVYQFRVLPFGFKNSPGIFQRNMNKLLRPLLDQHKLVCYLDDILIHSKDLETHLQTLEEVFKIFDQHKLQMHPRKCHFLRTSIRFLGHVVSEEGLAVCPDKVEAMQAVPEPTNLRQLRSVLGLFNYYRKFIPNFAARTRHMTDMLKKDQFVIFSEAARAEFHDVKQLLCEAPILQLPHSEFPFVIHCDASEDALGAVLSQDIGQGLRPVAYLSHKFSDTERNWNICEKETYALVKSLIHWRPYIHGANGGVTVYTDNIACTHLLTQKEVKGRKHINWMSVLADYGDQLQIKHVSGEQNRVADALSRVVSSFVSSETDEFSAGEGAKWPYATTSFLVQSSYRQIVKDVARSYDDVEWTKALLDWVKTGKTLSKRNALPKLPQPIKENLKHVHWESENGLMILRIPKHLSRIIIASCPATAQLRKEIIEEFHHALCHPGMAKTIDLVRKRYYWTGLKDEVIEFVNHCYVCLASKAVNHKPFNHPCPLPIPQRPWDEVSVDICCGLPAVPDERSPGVVYNAMIVWIDRFSKYCVAAPLSMGNQGSDAVACADLFLRYVFPYFGCPKKFVSDNGVQFHAAYARRLYEYFGIASQYTTSFHSQSNGQVERYNRTLLEALRAVCKDRKLDWVKCLPIVQFSINNTRHRVINHTPAFINSGRYFHMPMMLAHQLATPTEGPMDQGGNYVSKIVNRVKEVITLTRQHLEKAQREMINEMQKRSIVPNFRRGDKVYISTAAVPSLRTGKGIKLNSIFLGPFEITNMYGENVAELDFSEGQYFSHPEIQRLPIQVKQALGHLKGRHKFNVKYLRKYLTADMRYEYPEVKALEDPKMNNEGQTTYWVVYDGSKPSERLSAVELKERYGDSVFQSMRFWYDLSPSQEWVREVMTAPHPSDEQLMADQVSDSENQASPVGGQRETQDLSAENPSPQENFTPVPVEEAVSLSNSEDLPVSQIQPTSAPSVSKYGRTRRPNARFT